MLAIDPRREFLSRRIGKLDKHILRCFEMKLGQSEERRAQIDEEIEKLRKERDWMMDQVGKIPNDEAGDWVLRRFSEGPPGGSAETSAAYRVIE